MLQVIEISKGSKVKYELDKKSGIIKVYVSSTTPFHSGKIDITYIMDICIAG